MKNNWNHAIASQFEDDALKMRVYTSQLLGTDENLVLHGGGNTSVKTREQNLFGDEEEIIYVKGSGWDLATIEEAGFAPVKLNTLVRMAELDHLSDTDMVKYQRAAMTNPSAPNPSVEAILHAIIPFKFVDHTHADAVVTISNTPNGEERIRTIYGPSMLIVPYVMPGFILAKEIYNLTRNIDWSKLEGIILLNHGVFTFADDAKSSYDQMIDIVTRAEEYLQQHTKDFLSVDRPKEANTLAIAEIRQAVSHLWKAPVLAQLDDSALNTAFSNHSDVNDIARRGPLTPDHIIRTKRTPVVLSEDSISSIEKYAHEYTQYFNEFNNGKLVCLDKAPRWAVWPGQGTLSFGSTPKSIRIVRDITKHTMESILRAEQLGGWQALDRKHLFEMEYWVLEQEKLKKGKAAKPLQGKVAVITGAASGIGRACTERLVAEGAVVAALDINPVITSLFPRESILGIKCDVTQEGQIKEAIVSIVRHFGGIDMLVTNAGTFPPSQTIDNMNTDVWSSSIEVNLTSHLYLFKNLSPYLALGIDPAIVIVGSKNVPAPGMGAAAYSVAKAGLTQLGRVAAMEMGTKGIRINTIHPHAVFDTGIWDKETLQARAEHYNLSIEEYKTNNILKTEIDSTHVAELVLGLLGPAFCKVTGAQIPIDGGSNRTL